jgi:plastocyanin
VFSYVRTDHTVTKVSKSEYDACSGSDAMSEDNTSGLTTVTLSTPGMHYFICIMPDHCVSGMKLAVNGGGLLVPVMAPVVAAATGALIELGLL